LRHLRDKLRQPEIHVTPLQAFGPGEAEAIALASALGAVLMINERPGAQCARNIGLDVATVPSVIVLLRSRGVISDPAARQKLELIASNTARSVIDHANRAQDALLQGD
jgi:predicted nucleic acid-binding protein